MRYIVYDINGYEICRDMFPRFLDTAPSFRLLMLFDKDDILYEIQHLAEVQGDAARIKDDNTGALIERFKNVCTDENIDRPLRTIPLALSKCERMLSPWTKHVIGKHSSIKNDVDEKREFAIEMTVEEHFTSDLAWSLMRNIQEYIEAYVLDDWSGLTYPEGRRYWSERLAVLEAEIKKSITFMDDDCGAYIKPYI